MNDPVITHSDILYQDKYVIAVHKPAGLMVEPDSHGHPNAVDQVLGLLTHPPRIKSGLGVVYRLDRPVSGVLIFALTPMALKSLNEQIRQGRVRKIYRAEVEGNISGEKGIWDTPLRRSEDRKTAIPSSTSDKQAQDALTRWKVLDRKRDSTLLEIQIETGRFHQIRAHASSAGHPVIGDTTYGGTRTEGPGIRLEAVEYVFEHPKSGERVAVRKGS